MPSLQSNQRLSKNRRHRFGSIIACWRIGRSINLSGNFFLLCRRFGIQVAKVIFVKIGMHRNGRSSFAGCNQIEINNDLKLKGQPLSLETEPNSRHVFAPSLKILAGGELAFLAGKRSDLRTDQRTGKKMSLPYLPTRKKFEMPKLGCERERNGNFYLVNSERD